MPNVPGFTAVANPTGAFGLTAQTPGFEDQATLSPASPDVEAPIIPTLWYPADHSSVASVTLTLNTAYTTPVAFPLLHTFTAIGVFIAAYTGAGGVLRMGYYLDNGSGKPGALVTDLGTVADPGGGGAATITASIPLAGKIMYWLVAVPQTDATGLAGYANNGRSSNYLGQANPVGVVQSYTATGITGALPATFPAGAALGNNPLVIQLKA